MWHKAIWKGHPMRLEFTRVGLLVELANHYTTRGALLPFLDLLVERCDSSFLTSVYRKRKFTGLYLSWHSFGARSRKLHLIKCLSCRALNIFSDCKIEDELKVIKDIFIDNGYPEEVIDDNIKFTVTRLKNKNKTFGPPKFPVYFRLPWVDSANQFFAESIASSVYRCYHAVNLRPIFTMRTAFNCTHKDKLPIFKQSMLIYRFVCRCSSTYIGRTCPCLEVRIRQHVPRVILSKGRRTSGHFQEMASAIGEHLLTINTCRTSYEDDCLSVLHRDRNKKSSQCLRCDLYRYKAPTSMQTAKQSYFKYF